MEKGRARADKEALALRNRTDQGEKCDLSKAERGWDRVKESLSFNRMKMVSLSKNILMANRMNKRGYDGIKKGGGEGGDVKCIEGGHKKADMHFFKSKTELKCGMMRKAQSEFKRVKQTLINSNILNEDKTMEKKMICLNKNAIDYYSTIEVNDQQSKEALIPQKINLDQAQTPPCDTVNTNTFYHKLIRNIHKYRNIQSSQHQSLSNNSRHPQGSSNKPKIDVFELEKRINPNFSPFKKKAPPYKASKPTIKKHIYPSPLLLQSITKHKQREKSYRADSENKAKRIANSLRKLDEFIKVSIVAPTIPSHNAQEKNRDYSIETLVSSEELFESIQTCKQIISH